MYYVLMTWSQQISKPKMRFHNCKKIFKDDCKWYKIKQFFKRNKKPVRYATMPDFFIVEPFLTPTSEWVNPAPITVKDIQEANAKAFQTGNNTLRVTKMEKNRISFFKMDNVRNRKTLSYQTSSIYLTDVDVELKPMGNIYFSKEKSKILLQTINNLLEETTQMYNDICPETTLKLDLFDNFTNQLEPTIWEDEPNDILSIFNPLLFEEYDTVNDTMYDYLIKFLGLYMDIKETPQIESSNLQTYKGFSGSTLVLTN